MGVSSDVKPIFLLGSVNFDLQNLHEERFVNTSSHPLVDPDLNHKEPTENQRIGRITSNATSCVEEVRL